MITTPEKKPMRPNPEKPAILMPPYPGKSFGQCTTFDMRVPTGKRFPIETPEGTRWIPVIETRTVVQWVWDGEEWMSGNDFRLLYEREPDVPRERPLVSKHSVGNGPLRMRLAERQRREHNSMRRIARKGKRQ